MSKTKINFVYMLASLDLNAIWICYWLQHFKFRKIITKMLNKFIIEVMESFNTSKV